jgi:hypothetical protein
MRIHNIRYGFATNSSSSHSIVLLSTPAPDDGQDTYQEFGWDHFTIGNEENKLAYVGQAVKSNLQSLHNLSQEDAATLAEKYVDLERGKIDPTGYIDHQSVFQLPVHPVFKNSWRCPKLHKKYIQQLLDVVKDPNVVILGGSDNDDEDHHLSSLGTEILSRIMCDGRAGTVWGRYDEAGKFWSLFDIEQGYKVRFSFSDDVVSAEKSEVPELVDLKITDFCDRGCSYCYQDSKKTGEHGKPDVIKRIISCLSDLETFEVTFGGGEPTSHPQFFEILQHCASVGIVANFTTADIDFVIKNYEQIQSIGCVGGIGYSAGYGFDTEKLAKLFALNDRHSRPKITLHVVEGMVSNNSLEQTIKQADMFGFGVLVLGFKETGRATKPAYNKKEFNLEKVLDGFFEKKWWTGPHLSLDTMLVNKHKDWLHKHSDPVMFTSREGAHSMYIDGVKQTMHASSYDESEGVPIAFGGWNNGNQTEPNIAEFFRTI